MVKLVVMGKRVMEETDSYVDVMLDVRVLIGQVVCVVDKEGVIMAKMEWEEVLGMSKEVDEVCTGLRETYWPKHVNIGWEKRNG